MSRSTLSLASVRFVVLFAMLGGTLAPFGGHRALALPGESSSPAAAADPVLAEVVRLLEAGLGEPLVLRWLVESGKIPGRPMADDLVALKKAGASDELVAALLDRARAVPPQASTSPPVPPTPPSPPTPPTPATPAAPATPVSPTSESTPSAPVSSVAPTPPMAEAAPVTPIAPVAQVAQPASGPPPAPAPAPASAAASPVEAGSDSSVDVIVDAALSYAHVPEEGEAWDLVVYLDGTPFEPAVAQWRARDAGTSISQLRVAPGRHTLRWAQELHRSHPFSYAGGGTGRHAARVDPEPLVFELAAGSAASIVVEYRDPLGFVPRSGGPVTVRIAQEGREIAARKSSSDPALWPLLCEDVEASLDGRRPRLLERQFLRYCVRWDDLWPGVSDLPERDDVRPDER